MLSEILTCDFCNKFFDLFKYNPFILECGHTICKECLNKKNLFCGICKKNSIISIKNLKLEKIISLYSKPYKKKIFDNNSNNENKFNEESISFIEETNNNSFNEDLINFFDNNNKNFNSNKINNKFIYKKKIKTFNSFFDNVDIEEEIKNNKKNSIIEEKKIILNKNFFRRNTDNMEFKKKNYLTNAINKTNILISNNNKENSNDLNKNKNKFYTKKRQLSIYNYNNYNTNNNFLSEKKFFNFN